MLLPFWGLEIGQSPIFGGCQIFVFRVKLCKLSDILGGDGGREVLIRCELF